MVVLFLDIDGVLVKLGPGGKKARPAVADPKVVAALNVLTNMTDGAIVVTSDWRRHEDVASLANCFKNWGISGKVYDKTPCLWSNDRGSEILAWLARHKYVEKWVVFDDEHVALKEHQDKFVKVDGREGLTWFNVGEAMGVVSKLDPRAEVKQ